MTAREAIEAFKIDNALLINSGNDAVIERNSVAISALEKQIPQKPIGRYTDYKCPVCSRRVRSGKGSSSHQRDNVCQRCFQVLDWTE